MPAPLVNFESTAKLESFTPASEADFSSDTDSAVGPNHYLQVVNFALSIYDKSGTRLCSPVATTAFWAGLRGCTGNWSDSIVLYDRQADRWLISRFAKNDFPEAGSWNQCVAVSQSPDPTGAYSRYVFEISNQYFNDYPKFGIWPAAYAMTANADKIFSHTGVFVTAFERGAMLAGRPVAQMAQFFVPSRGGYFHMLPADVDGPTPPPAGSPGYVVQSLDDNLGFPADLLQLWAFQVDWTNPASASFSLAASLTPQPFNSDLCRQFKPGGSQGCIPQKDSQLRLDSLAYGYLMDRLTYRNFGDHEALLFNQTIDVGDMPDHAGIRWYELRQDPNNPWSIYQQGTYAPDANDRWLGSMAMDGAGDIALGFSVSSTSIYPAIRYDGRLASDPLGALPQAEASLIEGGGSQTGPKLFFGDYSQMSIDPSDDCTFWFTSAYYPTSSDQADWHTRIGAFRFPGCRSAS